jgi:hypothetical protein
MLKNLGEVWAKNIFQITIKSFEIGHNVVCSGKARFLNSLLAKTF